MARYGKHPHYETPKDRQRSDWQDGIDLMVKRALPRTGRRVLPDGTVEVYEIGE